MGGFGARRCRTTWGCAARLPNMRSIRVLGVDPGLTRCGLGIVDGAQGGRVVLVAVDVAKTPATDDIGARLVEIERQIELMLDAHQPHIVAVERVFSQHNVRSVMGTAQASAIAITCAARRGIPVAMHTPTEVKAAVTGNGRADKEQVAFMVRRLLGQPALVGPADATDALALAICQVWRGAAQLKVAAAQSKIAAGLAR
jgi:crossover junction endodeoxyribonuclease RuvC